MAGTALDSSLAVKTIRVSGISFNLVERLKHPLLIQLRVGHNDVVSVLLKRNEIRGGTRLFQKPRKLQEGSILTVQVQEKLPNRRDETLVRYGLPVDNLWPEQIENTPCDSQFKKLPIRLNDHKKQIWLNLDMLDSRPQSGGDDIGYISNGRVAHSITNSDSQDLKELEDYLLEGLELVEPRAIECTPGTRTEILADIEIKINDRDGANVIWIRGAPGSGKSSISLTAKSQLHVQDRLVTYFRFDRNEASTTTPTALWRYVAYDLACLLPAVRSGVLQQLRENRVDLDSPMVVFTSLVEGPLSKLTIDRPIVIVIDGLDECGGFTSPGHLSPDRQTLSETLRRWSQLPKHFKLLVTSRKEGDIAHVLSSIRSAPIDIPSGVSLIKYPRAGASIHTNNDIRSFLKARFKRVRERFPSLPTNWPGTETVDEMVRHAAGFFMWATAAADFIDIAPQDRLGIIRDQVFELGGMKPLYSLYAAIMEAAFGDIAVDDSEAEALQTVLGIMVLARRPLQDIEYTKILAPKSVTETMLESIRDGLRPLLVPDSGLRFKHKSFDDFLLSKECPSNYKINVDESQYLLAKFCLTTMTTELHFNMCGLETSSLKNVDVPDIANKVNKGIPPLLSYSCCFWAEHLNLTSFDDLLMDDVSEVVLAKLLYWFEAMSLLGKMSRVSSSLLLVLEWSHISPDDEFKDFVLDAHHFIKSFIYPITQSAPHIYISALPLAAESSSFTRHFLPSFPGVLERSTGSSTDGPMETLDMGRTGSPETYTIEGHTDTVQCVAFSPCGQKLASLGKDETIRVWDTKTREPLLAPIDDLPSSLYETLVWSPDASELLAYGCFDNIFGVWNMETGELTPLLDFRSDNGEDTSIKHIAFRSTDQQLVTSSFMNVRTRGVDDIPQPVAALLSWFRTFPHHGLSASIIDNTFHHFIWDTTTNQPLSLIFTDGDYVSGNPMAYSPSGQFFVAAQTPEGGNSSTLRVWNTQTGELAAGPSTLDGVICSLAFSPDERHVAISYDPFAHDDAAIWIWDSRTGRIALGPWKGHTKKITTLAFSPDGKKLVSGSHDCQIRVWSTALLKDSQASPDFSAIEVHKQDGWLKDADGKLLFWLPIDLRAKAIWSRNLVLVGSGETPTKLDLSRFKYGESWVECAGGGD